MNNEDLWNVGLELFLYNFLHFYVFVLLTNYVKGQKTRNYFIYSFNSILLGFCLVGGILAIQWTQTSTPQPVYSMMITVDGFLTLFAYSLLLFYVRSHDSSTKLPNLLWNITNYFFIFERTITTTALCSFLTTNIKTQVVFLAQMIVIAIYLVLYSTIYLLVKCFGSFKIGWLIFYSSILIAIMRSINMTQISSLSTQTVYRIQDCCMFENESPFIPLEYLLGIVGWLKYSDIVLILIILQSVTYYSFHIKTKNSSNQLPQTIRSIR
jgi:hypothetical protein